MIQNKTARIVWDQQERTRVALAVFEELKENHDKEASPSMVARLSREVLGERGRTYPNPNDMGWMNEMLVRMNSGTLKAENFSCKPEVPAELENMLNRPIATLDLSLAVKRRLADATFQTIGDLALSSDKDILAVKFLGTTHLEAIKGALEPLGLTTGMKIGKATEVKMETQPTPQPVVSQEDKVLVYVKDMMHGITENMVNFAEHFTLISLETMRKTTEESLALMQQQMMEDQIVAIQKAVKDSAQKYMSQAGFKVDPSKVPTKKIVIVGPRDGTAAELRRLYSNRCKKLFIWDGNQAMSLLEDNLKFADHVILQTGMVSHSANDKVKDVYRAEPIMVGKAGGNTELHRVIDSLLG